MSKYIRIECLRSAPPLFGTPIIGHWIKGPKWKTDEDHSFMFAGFHKGLNPRLINIPIVIKAGFIFDKASIPPCLWGWPLNLMPDGKITMPALEHDFLCQRLGTKAGVGMVTITPKDVHAHFRRRLIEYGESRRRANVFYWAVRLFGPGGLSKPRVFVRWVLGLKPDHQNEATHTPP